jgi:type I restriction enzyme R subunit
LQTKLQNAIIESCDAHTVMSTQALNSPILLCGILDVLLNHSGLYESLRGRAAV